MDAVREDRLCHMLERSRAGLREARHYSSNGSVRLISSLLSIVSHVKCWGGRGTEGVGKEAAVDVWI